VIVSGFEPLVLPNFNHIVLILVAIGALISFLFGVNRITDIERVIYKNGCHDIFDKDRMERFDIFADYLEKNLDSILCDQGLWFLRKYHK